MIELIGLQSFSRGKVPGTDNGRYHAFAISAGAELNVLTDDSRFRGRGHCQLSVFLRPWLGEWMAGMWPIGYPGGR
jgi:hypothetical protein